MALTETSPAPVYFEGDWTTSKIDAIEAAVAEAEDRLASDSSGTSDADGAPWVAIHHATDSTDMFAVSRIGIPTVVSAQTLAALVRGIRELAQSGSVSPLLPTGP